MPKFDVYPQNGALHPFCLLGPSGPFCPFSLKIKALRIKKRKKEKKRTKMLHEYSPVLYVLATFQIKPAEKQVAGKRSTPESAEHKLF